MQTSGSTDRGDVDSPKSVRSVRFAALSDGLLVSIDEWRALSLDTATMRGCSRRRNSRRLWPRTIAGGEFWTEAQASRFGLGKLPGHAAHYSSLLKELDVDPHVRAEQMGHTMDVNENVYTFTSLKRRKEAVNALEKAIGA